MSHLPSWALVTVAGMALTLAGCSSSGDAAAPAASSASSSAAPVATAAGSDSDARLASRLCTALSKKTAEMQMANASPVAAQAQIVIALSDVYGDDVAPMDGAKIEAMTKQTCPEVHDEALTTMEKDSFDQL